MEYYQQNEWNLFKIEKIFNIKYYFKGIEIQGHIFIQFYKMFKDKMLKYKILQMKNFWIVYYCKFFF